MNLLLQKQKEFTEKETRITELTNLDTLNDEQQKELGELTPSYLKLRGEIEDLVSVQKTKEWSDQLDVPAGFFGKAGDELVVQTKDGARSIDGDGQYVSSEVLKMTMEPTYKSALNNLLRFREDHADLKTLNEVQRKAMTEGLDTGGGYVVPADMSDRILVRRPHPSTLPGAVDTVTSSRDRLTMLRLNYTTDDIYSNATRIAWTGESGTTAEDTGLEQWGEHTISVYTGSFEIQASMDLLEDAAVDLETFLVREASRSYMLGIDNIIVNGTGIGQPKGLLVNPGAANEPPTVNLGNPVTADNLIAWVYGLPPQYAERASALTNRTSVYATWAQIKDSANNYVFGLTQNIDGGLANARQAVLLGYPMIFSAFMPNAGGAANVGVFGDLREAYTRVRRVGLTVTPYGNDDATMRRANRRGFHFRFREGGSVVQPRAVRIGVQS